MVRADARASYWKERFLYGLPKAFNDKVQESLREKHNGTIPFDSLTYGDGRTHFKRRKYSSSILTIFFLSYPL